MLLCHTVECVVSHDTRLTAEINLASRLKPPVANVMTISGRPSPTTPHFQFVIQFRSLKKPFAHTPPFRA